MRKDRSWNPFHGRSRKCKIITGLVFIALLIVIVLVAVGISKALRKVPTVSILLPLYVYPSQGAWDPLYDAVKKYPNLQFVTVINPSSGPWLNGSLDDNYQRELPNLNSKKNVLTIGYVRTNYTNRPMSEVLNDIDIYASWSKNTTNIAMHGIFFDEAPNAFTASGEDYMQQVDAYAKNSTGFGGINYVIHNPGAIPGDNRMFTGADLIVVFEDNYASYSGNRSQELSHLPSQSINNYQRKNFAYLVNSVPSSWGTNDLQTFIQQIQTGGQYIFVTDLSLSQGHSIYGQFGSDWSTFTEAMNSFSN